MTKRKGIILAGGSGTRLYPLTKAVSKHMLQLWDKPIIYYPLSILMLAGISDIAIITTAEDKAQFQRLLGNGNELGISIEWIVQPSPDGLAQAYILAEEFLDGQPSAMILGDNVFYGHGLGTLLSAATERHDGGTVFTYKVADPTQYGVIELGDEGRPISIEEKPQNPVSDAALTGLYFFDSRASEWAKQISTSARGELEITSLIERYMVEGDLTVEPLGRGYVWLDTGTHEGLIEAGEFVSVIEKSQGLKIGCIEEVAYRTGLISLDELHSIANQNPDSRYGRYLINIVEKENIFKSSS